MKLLVNKTTLLQGELTPPSSKSQNIRAIFIASLCEGTSFLKNILHSSDTQDAIKVCRDLSVAISESGSDIVIQGSGLPLQLTTSEIYSGNSGLATHFIIPLLGLRKNADQAVILDCGNQMRARPIKALVEALRNLGLNIDYLNNENTLPVSISGQLKGGNAFVDGTTSQYLSALLLSLPLASGDSEIKVKNLQERPYVEMTLNWLKDQNIKFDHQSLGDTDTYFIKGRQKYSAIKTTMPGDFSSASCLIAASALIPGEVILKDLNMADLQGDKRLVTLLQEMGADIVIEPTHLLIRGGKKLSGIKIDAKDVPDLLPALAVIGTFASGKTEIVNVAHARIKETDRIHSMTEGLTRMGAKIEEKRDGLVVYSSQLQGAKVKGYGDHRTVMALSVAGMLANGETCIDESDAINKTFPTFVTLMQSIGAKLHVGPGL